MHHDAFNGITGPRKLYAFNPTKTDRLLQVLITRCNAAFRISSLQRQTYFPSTLSSDTLSSPTSTFPKPGDNVSRFIDTAIQRVIE